jgi:hypothetical protein
MQAGVFGEGSLESLYMVEVDIDDEFLAMVFPKMVAKFGRSLRDLDFSHNHLNNSY